MLYLQIHRAVLDCKISLTCLKHCLVSAGVVFFHQAQRMIQDSFKYTAADVNLT